MREAETKALNEEEAQRLFCSCDEVPDLEQLKAMTPEKQTQMIFYAIMRESLPLLSLLVESGADIDKSQKGGVTPLMYACQQGELSIADFLVKKGALVFGRCEKGFNLLVYAAMGRSLPMVRWAFERGCDPSTQDHAGFSVFHALVSRQATPKEETVICDIIDYLVNQGVTIPVSYPSPYALACEFKLFSAAKRLGVIGKPSLLDPSWMLGFAREIKARLTEGADPNEVSEEGDPVLMIASLRGCTETVDLLIEAGADVHCVDKQQINTLHLLALFGDKEDFLIIAESLILAGIEVNQKTPEGETALSLALKNENPLFAELLRKHGGVES